MEQKEEEGDRGSIRTTVNLDFIKGRWYVKKNPLRLRGAGGVGGEPQMWFIKDKKRQL